MSSASSTPSAEPRPRHLPPNASLEHLRKQAKRLAKQETLQLAEAQHALAQRYGYKSWAQLIHAVGTGQRATKPSDLAAAASRGDLGQIRTLLARGDDPDGSAKESPLQLVCRAAVADAVRYEAAHLLLEAGASPRKLGEGGTTALHEAASRGPRELVELLIRHGGLVFQADTKQRTPLDHARAAKQPAIVHLLDRPVLDEPRFKAAVFALRHGSLAALERILDAHPDLLQLRAIEPDCYPRDYFRDPKLVWFLAWNPTPPEPVPPNLLDLARSMLRRGVAADDLDYTLELVLTGAAIRSSGQQDALIDLLLDAGATLRMAMVVVALAERATAPVERLLQNGLALTAPIAAALNRIDDLARLLPQAPPDELRTALGLAVLHGNEAAARLCLDAGADANDAMPVHHHAHMLHQAANNDDVAMAKLLVERGARLDVTDRLWNATPLGWAEHQGKKHVAAWLRAAQRPEPAG